MKPLSDILAYLLDGGRLTVQRAFHLFHTTELRKIVSRLRRRGYNISSIRREGVTEEGRKVMYNEYYIENNG